MVINSLEVGNLNRLTVLCPAGAVAGVIDRGDIVSAMAKKLNMPITEGEKLSASNLKAAIPKDYSYKRSHKQQPSSPKSLDLLITSD